MKLRLVREDGTPAQIEDLAAFEHGSSVEIDGVTCRIGGYEGPDGGDERWGAPSDAGVINLELLYQPRRREVVRRANHRSFTSVEYDCPFARRRRARAKETR